MTRRSGLLAKGSTTLVASGMFRKISWFQTSLSVTAYSFSAVSSRYDVGNVFRKGLN
jgi:hypothetical protein